MTKTCIVACNCNPTSSFKFYSLDIAPTCLSHWTTALRFLVARTSRRNWQQNLACTDSRVPLAPLKLHVRLKLTCQHIKQKIHSNKWMVFLTTFQPAGCAHLEQYIRPTTRLVVWLAALIHSKLTSLGWLNMPGRNMR